MGRGRAKAKQQKVARALKYSAHETDLEALQRELANGGDGSLSRASAQDEVVDDEDDGDEDLPDDDDGWSSSRSG